MNRKSNWLKLALCASLLTPLPTYASGYQGTDNGGTGTQSTRERVGQSVDDAAITGKVKAAILRDHMLKVLDISVKTDEGIVTLSGTVDTRKALAHATAVAKRVKGVKSVKNELKVESKAGKRL